MEVSGGGAGMSNDTRKGINEAQTSGNPRGQNDQFLQ